MRRPFTFAGAEADNTIDIGMTFKAVWPDGRAPREACSSLTGPLIPKQAGHSNVEWCPRIPRMPGKHPLSWVEGAYLRKTILITSEGLISIET